jgi:hypothetical protein
MPETRMTRRKRFALLRQKGSFTLLGRTWTTMVLNVGSHRRDASTRSYGLIVSMTTPCGSTSEVKEPCELPRSFAFHRSLTCALSESG